MSIEVRKITKRKFATDLKAAKNIYKKAFKAIKNKNSVTISFEGITMLTTSFLSESIGILYKSFTPQEIESYLTIESVEGFEKMINHVKEVSRIFYQKQI